MLEAVGISEPVEQSHLLDLRGGENLFENIKIQQFLLACSPKKNTPGFSRPSRRIIFAKVVGIFSVFFVGV